MRNRNLSIRAVSFDIRNTVIFIKSYSNTVMLLTLFTCGMTVGTVSVKNSEYVRYLIDVFGAASDSDRVLINGLLAIILALTVNFVMGLCLVGAPFIAFGSVAEGIYIGMLYGYHLYCSGYNNFSGFFLTDIIYYVFIYMIFIVSQHFALSMSISLKEYYYRRKSALNLKNYLIKFLVLVFGAIFIIILKSVIVALI